MSLRFGREFYKMSGSGNDFVVFDARRDAPGELADPANVERMCARATGIGADGVVFLEGSEVADFSMRYYNRDGSRASLCGNAALCVTRLAAELGAATAGGMVFESDAGRIEARLRDGEPEIDLQPVSEVLEDFEVAHQEGERRIGFSLVGDPHLVILCEDVSRADVQGRGRSLRHHPALAHGANVNFVSPEGACWAMRTFERGVEGETLACGTGAVASAILLSLWGLTDGAICIRTRSGKQLTVRLERSDGLWLPSLSGEGRVVFHASLGEL
jgi:diaminopimelate epimerase